MTQDVATRLWNARMEGDILPRDFKGYPKTEADGYSIQSHLISVSGLPVIGWKIGATTEALLGTLGLSQPFPGPLFSKFTHANDAEVKIRSGHSLEAEFSIRMKEGLPYRTERYSRSDIEQAVGSICPSFEIVGKRFEGPAPGAGFRLIADGGANVASVMGAAIEDWSAFDLTDHHMTLSVNDETVVEGSSRALLWDHIFDAASWLACQPALANRGVLAGDIIMTGTCTGVRPLNPGDEVAANFGKLGVVRARFVAE